MDNKKWIYIREKKSMRISCLIDELLMLLTWKRESLLQGILYCELVINMLSMMMATGMDKKMSLKNDNRAWMENSEWILRRQNELGFPFQSNIHEW